MQTSALQVLVLAGRHLSDAAIQHLAQSCPMLASIELVGCERLTDAAPAALLVYCQLLTALTVQRSAGVHGAFPLPPSLATGGECALQLLDLSHCTNLHPAALAQFAPACASLGSLSLNGCEAIGDECTVQLISNAPYLRTVSLEQCRGVGDATLFALARTCAHLLSLNVSNTAVSVVGLSALAGACFELSDLDLSACQHVDDAAVSAVCTGRLPLEQLALSELVNLSDNALNVLPTTLRTLRLSYDRSLSDVGLVYLARCSQLTSLDLSHCPAISLASLRALLPAWPALRKLSLRGWNELKMSGFKHATLEQLTLSWCKNMTDSALCEIADGCPSLRELDVAWCARLTDQSVHRLLMRGNDPTLSSLNIRGCSRLSVLVIRLLHAHKGIDVTR